MIPGSTPLLLSFTSSTIFINDNSTRKHSLFIDFTQRNDAMQNPQCSESHAEFMSFSYSASSSGPFFFLSPTVVLNLVTFFCCIIRTVRIPFALYFTTSCIGACPLLLTPFLSVFFRLVGLRWWRLLRCSHDFS